MISINKVVDAISDKRLQLDGDGLKTGQINKLKGQIAFLTTASHYLRTFPTDDFVKSELKRLANRIKLIEDDFGKWIPNKQYPNERKKFSEYQKQMDVPKIKMQIRALKFISND